MTKSNKLTDEERSNPVSSLSNGLAVGFIQDGSEIKNNSSEGHN